MDTRNQNRRRNVARAQIQEPWLKAVIIVLKIMLFILLCGIPLSGSLLLGIRFNSYFWFPLVAYGTFSVLTFFLYKKDKDAARNDRWRTPEITLHLAELFFGWPGALLAQQVFRHKNRKVSYQLWFWLIVLVHQVGWFIYLFPDLKALAQNQLLETKFGTSPAPGE